MTAAAADALVDRRRDVSPSVRDEGGRRFAYVSSRYPDPLQTYIAREVAAVARAVGGASPYLSLKPAWSGQVGTRTAAADVQSPTLRRTVQALPVLFRSGATRRLVRDVLAAYAGHPRDQAKALAAMALALALVPVIRRHGIRHVHAHFAAMPGLAAHLLHRLIGISYSIAAHGWDIYVDRAMLREKLASAEFVVACTRAGHAALLRRGAPPDRTILCYHGVPLRELPHPVFVRDDATFRILAVGRLVEQKGFRTLIEACRLLLGHGLRFECRIIGDGPLRADLRRRTAACGLDRVVRLEGTLSPDAVLAAHRHARVLCAPSIVAADWDRDGIPNVVLEAMSQGLPVVGSRISGIPEAIEHGSTGWLVDPGDPDDLADALLSVSRAPGEAARRALAAYARVAGMFDVERNVGPLVERLTQQRVAAGGAAAEPRPAVLHAGT